MDKKMKEMVEKDILPTFYSISKMEDKEKRNEYIKAMTFDICSCYGLNPIEFIDVLNECFKKVKEMKSLSHEQEILVELVAFKSVGTLHDIEGNLERESRIRKYINEFCSENIVDEALVVEKLKRLYRVPTGSSMKGNYSRFRGNKLDRIMRLPKKEAFRIEEEDIKEIFPDLQRTTQTDDEGPSL